MNLEFPLIRFDNKEWLEKLNQGDLFLRHSLYYQGLDSQDSARSDTYDGSIPAEHLVELKCKENGNEIQIQNSRLMNLNYYIKCFFHCNGGNIKLYPPNYFEFVFSEKCKQEIRSFNVDSALIIFSPTKFFSQIQNVCTKRNETVSIDDVHYLDEKQYSVAAQGIVNGTTCTETVFYKHKRFSNQQELRVCVHHNPSFLDENMTAVIIPRKVTGEPYSIDIGALEDTMIVSLEELLDKRLIIQVDA